jgi:hypothetical protein
MKKLFLTLLAVLGLASLASAQQYTVGTFITNRITDAGVTSNYTTAVVMTRYDSIAVLLKCQCMDASTSNVVFQFQRSLDNSQWTDLPRVEVALNGTTPVITNFTYDVGPLGYFRLSSCGSTSEVALPITNILVRYSLKPDRRDK